MQWSRFWQNVLFAVLLFVVLSAVVESNLPMTGGLKRYLVFVLTTDYDFSRILGPVRSSLSQIPGSAVRLWDRLTPPRDASPSLSSEPNAQ